MKQTASAKPTARSLADRFTWATELLGVSPLDQLLEIGCGHGLAVSLLCEKLARGRLTAIDRSRTMIAAARKRNAAQIAAGKVRFENVALADADFGRRRFSKIFAINVNLFWIDPSRELPVVRKALRQDGALYLFYQPPSFGQLKLLAGKLARNLEANGFAVDRVVSSGRSPARLLYVIAHAAGSAV
jgi:SAM-dependent methyltransferase